ncbi:pyridoxamine 5'-phosphate oxidase family protein [Halobaculum marinum]|uniref:Pyridoxamine 5'-phosphate oxidase family protein n=1 Tax=Halobaculum marinum TaxID=3031996 RepID=A0ABD5WZN8_9EURY|nr:pyridoxamine 5'-phosphate oxidase family protein [Halobaculum sp. DT55]
MDVTDRVYTAGMTDDEVDERLRTSETGVLALARDDDAYAIPLAYHYDGDAIRFRLSDDGHSRKLAFLETTGEASFVVYGYDGPRDSWSVLVAGSVRELSPDEADVTAAEVDERYAPLRVFDEATEETTLRTYELQIEAVTGRRTAE